MKCNDDMSHVYGKCTYFCELKAMNDQMNHVCMNQHLVFDNFNYHSKYHTYVVSILMDKLMNHVCINKLLSVTEQTCFSFTWLKNLWTGLFETSLI